MFGVSRQELIHGLTRLGGTCCGYTSDPAQWLGIRCDCKYGGDLRKNSEATSCPELRSVVALLQVMQDNEYEALCRRANIVEVDDYIAVVIGAATRR